VSRSPLPLTVGAAAELDNDAPVNADRVRLYGGRMSGQNLQRITEASGLYEVFARIPHRHRVGSFGAGRWMIGVSRGAPDQPGREGQLRSSGTLELNPDFAAHNL